MAELAILSGVKALLPLCRDGFTMIKAVFHASETIGQAAARVQMQQDQYDEWAEMWASPESPDAKFRDYANDNPRGARRVLDQLALFSKTMFDAKALQDSYGLKLDHLQDLRLEDLRLDKWQSSPEAALTAFKKKCKFNLSFIKKCTFVMKDDDKRWNDLILLLREYNENLSRLGPKDGLERINKAFIFLDGRSLNELRLIAQVSNYEALRADNSQRYHDIALAAEFSAAVQLHQGRVVAPVFDISNFKIDQSYRVLSSEEKTMAVLQRNPITGQRLVVLIEWRNNSSPGGRGNIEAEASMLFTPRPGRLLLPNCYGIVEDTLNGRSGLMLAPPDYIGKTLPAEPPQGSVSQRRMPVSLRALLEQGTSAGHAIDLGIRFRLAKKLADAVYMMHCVGWVHKNIRPDSILFFPAKSKHDPGPSLRIPQRLELDEPMFVGLGKARVDDVVKDSGVEYFGEDKAPGVGFYGRDQVPGDINLDYYHHPDKRKDRNIRYSRSYDLYSLGCVLLELGLWKPLSKTIDVTLPPQAFTRGLQDCAAHLEGYTGSVYAGAVQRCLSIHTIGRTEAGSREASRVCLDIAAELQKCVA